MSNHIRIVLAVFLLSVGVMALAAPRTIVISDTAAVVTSVSLYRLPDAGVRAEVCGKTSQTDGGSVHVDNSCVQWDLSGANATTASNFMTGPALTKWKTDNEL